ncbi:MAG: rhomboid family intramembrane serine protease, partial [Chloroflexi bacterium]|nr:rhomboid family intramembrane serine protease [Chloroflexota bacterium]
MDDTCATHPSALAQVRCAGCGRLLCWECARPVRGRYFCAACAGAVAKR